MEPILITDSESESCIVCEKPVRYGTGFAHLKHGDAMVTLCCPLCMATFQKNPSPFVARFFAQKLIRGGKAD